jgi:hypothetical protein
VEASAYSRKNSKRNRQSTQGQTAQRRLSPPTENVSHDRQYDLRAARDKCLTLLSSQINEEDTSWSKYVVPAAEHLLSVFEQMLNDSNLWNELKQAEVETAFFPADEVRALRETVDSDLVGILDFLQYTPPPPSAELAYELQSSLEDLLSDPDAAARAGLTRAAEKNLTFYIIRLRRLLAKLDKSSGAPLDTHVTGRKVMSAVEKGVVAAGPAIIATAVTGALFPPAAVPGVAGAAIYGVTVAAKDLSERSVQAALKAAATRVFGKLLADEELVADSRDARNVAAVQFEEVAVDLTAELADLLQGPVEGQPDTIRALAIEATRAAYEVLRAQAAVDDGRDALVEPPVLESLSALRQLRDWEQRSLSKDELLKVTQDFAAATTRVCEKLRLAHEQDAQ